MSFQPTIAVLVLVAAQSGAAQQISYETVRVTDGIYAFIPGELGAGNSVAIIRDRDVVVVDSTISPSGARTMIREIRRLTANPVRYLITTHWHDDHIWGNQEYRARFADIVIIAHPETRRGMIERAIPSLDQTTERLGRRIAERESLLQRGVDAEGRPLDEQRRAGILQRNEQFRAMLSDLATIEPTLRGLPTASGLTLHGQGREVRVLFLGRGHTAGDLVVHVPESGVVIACDLLTHPFLAAAEAFPDEWIVTLQRMAALEPDVIVPGHGPVLRDRDHLELMIRLLSAVVGQVRDAAERGLTADSILDSIDVDELRGQLLGDDAGKRRAFEPFFLRPAVESVLREAPADR